MAQNNCIYLKKSEILLRCTLILTIINIVKTVENKALTIAKGAIKWVN